MERKKKNYVSNVKLLEHLIEYKYQKDRALAGGTTLPRIPEYIGECLLKIAKNLAHKPNFNGYTYKDDMIGDAILNCVTYLDNFNPEKTKNPFAYFTQIIYYAFLRKIEGEKKQTYIKCKVMENVDFTDFNLQIGDDSKNGSFKNGYIDHISENIDDIIKTFEDKKKKSKEKKLIGLDKFTESSE